MNDLEVNLESGQPTKAALAMTIVLSNWLKENS